MAGGILWPDGKNYNEYDEDGNLVMEYNTPQQWRKLGQLLRHARAGLWDASKPLPLPKVILHNEHGGRFSATEWFFDKILPEFDNFDVIGLSHYYHWQGELHDLQDNLEKLSAKYDKELAVVETAYPWTMDAFDDYSNFVVDEKQLHLGYPPTKEGQKDFILDMRDIVANVPGGLGVCYWGTSWIVSPFKPSAWENLALFDRMGKALPGLAALGGNSTTREPSPAPSNAPSLSSVPSSEPSLSLEPSTSMSPSSKPSGSAAQSLMPSIPPSMSNSPSDELSSLPSIELSSGPSLVPNKKSSIAPSVAPSSGPSIALSSMPSLMPSQGLSSEPSMALWPSTLPSSEPSIMVVPSNEPSLTLSDAPSQEPSNVSAQQSVPAPTAVSCSRYDDKDSCRDAGCKWKGNTCIVKRQMR